MHVKLLNKNKKHNQQNLLGTLLITSLSKQIYKATACSCVGLVP